MGNMAARVSSKEKRQRRIVHNDQIAESYADLGAVRLPYSRRTARPRETWKEGLYPVEVQEGPDDSTVRVHYIGWDKKYDENKRKTDIVSHPLPCSGILNQLAIQIKEQLTGGHKTDSSITVRIEIHNNTDIQDVEWFLALGTVYKRYKDRTVYIINSRNSLCPALGESWDYRVVNSNCDNYYVKTETVRFYVRNKRPLVDLILFPDHTEDHFLSRGKVLTFSFVRCPGNKEIVPELIGGNML
ncbi:uncharacterized protein LOC110441999 [Mizuhopecten yessoensis]|uniref:uncharacterized protein LOC110441999 n=1 Tax=Mizuhopecten yessoensis TaxID=6573 RepID=UPI000B45D42D|nr:uncharacterized protein LOC110441999 [Mizuhopecten yessoensis]